jgi:copper chaperone CopZ
MFKLFYTLVTKPLHNPSSPEFSKKILGRSHEITLEFLTEIQVMTSFVAVCRSIIIMLLLTTPALANHQGHSHLDITGKEAGQTLPKIKDANHTITVKINGLVCDFCARALEKVFGKREEVSGIDVNLDTKIVTIGFKKDADIDDATITKLITDAGYNVVEIKR